MFTHPNSHCQVQDSDWYDRLGFPRLRTVKIGQNVICDENASFSKCIMVKFESGYLSGA